MGFFTFLCVSPKVKNVATFFATFFYLLKFHLFILYYETLRNKKNLFKLWIFFKIEKISEPQKLRTIPIFSHVIFIFMLFTTHTYWKKCPFFARELQKKNFKTFLCQKHLFFKTAFKKNDKIWKKKFFSEKNNFHLHKFTIKTFFLRNEKN